MRHSWRWKVLTLRNDHIINWSDSPSRKLDVLFSALCYIYLTTLYTSIPLNTWMYACYFNGSDLILSMLGALTLATNKAIRNLYLVVSDRAATKKCWGGNNGIDSLSCSRSLSACKRLASSSALLVGLASRLVCCVCATLLNPMERSNVCLQMRLYTSKILIRSTADVHLFLILQVGWWLDIQTIK